MQKYITEEEANKIIAAGYNLEKRLKNRTDVRLVVKVASDASSYDKPKITLKRSCTEFWEHEWQQGDTVESFLASLEARAKISNLFESL